MTTSSDDHDPEDGLQPGMVLAVGVIIYGAIASAGLLWLWLRGRLEAVSEQSIGERGLLASAAIGLAVGVCGAFVVNRLCRRIRGFEELASAAQAVFARSGDGVGIAFALLSAFAEELFFRLAVQDAFGLIGSVAAYVLMNSSIGGVRWVTFVFCHALILGLLVWLGFGLLGSTTAHAILNYLCLRRLQT